MVARIVLYRRRRGSGEAFAKLDLSALNSSNSTELVTGININFEPIFSPTTQYRKASSLSKKEVCVKLVLAYSSKKNSSHEKADLIKGWLSLVWRGRKFLFFKSFRNGQTHSQPFFFKWPVLCRGGILQVRLNGECWTSLD